VVVATVVMAMLLNYFVPEQVRWFEADFWQALGWLTGAIIGGGVAYIGTLFATGMRPSELVMKPPAHSLSS
jgi:peptidoglycan biosynthesis protein MviN/MurJ (putative lipid II flippase)